MSQRDAHLFTSESVTEGHPDKVADQISDAVLDEVLRADPTGRVACETLELMPLPITLAHRLTRRLSELRHAGEIPWLRPDGKSQVTVEYEGARPSRVHTVVISTQHDPEIAHEQLRREVIEHVIRAEVPAELLDERTVFHVNPTGRFVIGGPQGDCGLTGRKIIVDTYGGAGRHGGGAFSGKDPTKVARSACYMARYIAKNVVAAGLAESAEIQLAYAIGVADPMNVTIYTEGTGKIADHEIAAIVNEV